MNAQFYELSMMDLPETWILEIVRDAHGEKGAGYGWRDLGWAWRVEVAPPLEIAVTRAGAHCDVSFAQEMVPVVSSRVAEVLRPLIKDEVEFIPTRIAGVGGYFVLNILSVVTCLDEQKTQYVEKWTEESSRPELTGEYKMLSGIVIEPAAATGHNLFRLGGQPGHTIASSAVKNAFEQHQFTGARFRDVCSPKSTADDVVKGKPRYQEFYRQLLAPLVSVYGPVETISAAVVGFDAGGPVKMCVLRASPGGEMTAYVTCELAVREQQKPSPQGRFELFTICDSVQLARRMLTCVGHLSMLDALGAGYIADLRPTAQLTGSIEGVLMELYTNIRIESHHYGIFRCIGLTSAEMEFVGRDGVETLRQRLVAAGAYDTTSGHRDSVI